MGRNDIVGRRAFAEEAIVGRKREAQPKLGNRKAAAGSRATDIHAHTHAPKAALPGGVAARNGHISGAAKIEPRPGLQMTGPRWIPLEEDT